MDDDKAGAQMVPKVRTRRYVEFLFARSFTADYQTEEVGHADPALVSVPDGAYAFRFFDIREADDNGVLLRSARLNLSKTFYYGGTLKTLDEVRLMPDSRILASNMECNGWPAVVFSRYGNWPQPFDPKHVVIIPAPPPPERPRHDR